MDWLRIAAVALMCGSALLPLGCDRSDSGSVLPTDDWVTFEGEYASVRLPDSFVGGNPAESKVMAALRERAASVSDPEERATAQSLLRELRETVLRRDEYQDYPPPQILLFALGDPGTAGGIPAVLVYRSPLNEEDLLQIQTDRSIRAFVEGKMWGVLESELTIESVTEDRASVVVFHRAEGPDDTTVKQRIELRVAGRYIYDFEYQHSEVSNPYLDGVFAASAETVIIKSP